jgi:hypothetical protein
MWMGKETRRYNGKIACETWTHNSACVMQCTRNTAIYACLPSCGSTARWHWASPSWSPPGPRRHRVWGTRNGSSPRSWPPASATPTVRCAIQEWRPHAFHNCVYHTLIDHRISSAGTAQLCRFKATHGYREL